MNAAAKPFDGKNRYIRITDIDDNSRSFLQTDLTSPDTNLGQAKSSILQEGDIVFARTGASVGKTYIYNKNDGLVYFAGFLIRVRVKPEYNADFVFQNTLTKNYAMFINITSQRSGQPGVNAQEYASFTFLTPTLPEQARIGTFFRHLDRLITLHQCNCNMATRPYEWSSGLRAIAWEQRNTSYLGNFFKGQGYSKADLLPDGTPIILYGQLYTNYQFTITEVNTYAQKKKNTILSKGNEVIVPASGETAEDIARASAVRKKGVILGGDLNIIVPIPSMNAEFFALSLSNGFPQKKLAQKAQGKSVVHIHNSDIQEISITYPSLEEQNRIASFFRHLDRLITLHQRKHILLT